MTNNFFTNNIFEENLNIGWNIDGEFEINDSYILQHYKPLEKIIELNSFNVDNSIDFEFNYRWSFDNTNFSNFIPINDFIDFPLGTDKIWIQIQIIYNGLDTGYLKEITIEGKREINEFYQPTNIGSGSHIKFTNTDTYKVYSLNDFEIFLSSGNVSDLNLYFRYTQTQGRHWTEWIKLTKENLQASKFERLKFCNFEFGFHNIGNEDIGLYDLELIGNFQNITADYSTTARLGIKSQCDPLLQESDCDDGSKSCVPCSQGLTPWNQNLNNCNSCELNNVVNLNDRTVMMGQISTYEILNQYVQEKNSWKIKYILTDTDKKGTDYVLHEHTIKNMILMKDFNIIVPNNQFPVENANFNGLDFDLIQSFEIHIMKNKFKQMFGLEFRPSEGDGIYFCDLNQLWEIEQMFPHRGLMNTEIYYRVLLKKWNDKSSRKPAKTQEGEVIGNFLDEITSFTSLGKLFDIDVNSEIKQNTKDKDSLSVSNPNQQNTDTTIMTLIKNTNSVVSYNNEEIWNASLTISKSQYKIPIKSKGIKSVEYNYKDNIIGKADNRSISFWFKTEDYKPEHDYTIISNYDYNDNLGYRVNIFDGLLTVTINNLSYSLPIANISNNKWYVMLINIDQIREKVELSIYTRQNENGKVLTDSQLLLFIKKEYDFIPQAYSIDTDIFIGGCDTMSNDVNKNNWYLTNLTIWNQPIPKGTKRNILLNQYLVHDSHLTILVDSCDKPLILPFYGNI